MANLKYSRQREAIKDYLSSVTTHPNGGYCIYAYQRRIPEYQSRNRLPQFKSACRHRRGD